MGEEAQAVQVCCLAPWSQDRLQEYTEQATCVSRLRLLVIGAEPSSCVA